MSNEWQALLLVMAIKLSWTEKTIVLRLTFPLLTGQSLTMASLIILLDAIK